MAATSASAAITFGFEGGVGTPSAGFAIINTFDTPGEQALVSCPSGTCGFQTGSDGNGAANPFSDPTGTPYLTVLRGPASISFGPTSRFQFDWGSLDSYNTLVIHGSFADITVIPGTASFPNDANGNQFAPGTNGRFTVRGNAGESFTGITLSSTQNSFEVDNLAVAVPEPATWAFMIMGFGGAGAMLRRRRAVAA